MIKNTEENLMFDVRVLHHRLRRGDITREAYEAFLARLPDDGGESVETETAFATPYADRHYTGGSSKRSGGGSDETSAVG